MTTFRLATRQDDADLRALLRDNAMSTWVEMSIEREPSFFAGCTDEEWAVIGEDGKQTVAMYTGAAIPAFVDGAVHTLGYLGGLRVTPSQRNRIRLIREGYASIEQLAPIVPSLPWWFTVIATENVTARRLLEAGLPGMPRYWPLGEYVTYGLPSSRGRHRGLWTECGKSQTDTLIAFHNERAAKFDLAPVLQRSALERIGTGQLLLYAPDGEIAGVAALWDQRTFKQIVARRYSSVIRALLPVHNAYARLFRRITLPREGAQLHQTFIAYLALAENAMSQAKVLLQDLLARCRTPVASLGLHADHPLIPVLEEFGPMRYPARVYGVSFSEQPVLHGRPVQPEVALL